MEEYVLIPKLVKLSSSRFDSTFHSLRKFENSLRNYFGAVALPASVNNVLKFLLALIAQTMYLSNLCQDIIKFYNHNAKGRECYAVMKTNFNLSSREKSIRPNLQDDSTHQYKLLLLGNPNYEKLILPCMHYQKGTNIFPLVIAIRRNNFGSIKLPRTKSAKSVRHYYEEQIFCSQDAI